MSIEILNLQQQVEDNANKYNQIIEGNLLLAEFGIRVVGKVNSSSDLPDPVTYTGVYGDAYLVGTKTPYDYYLFTRPFPGETLSQWFNIGEFPAKGPKGDTGPTGPDGPKGQRGSQWFSGYDVPSPEDENYEVGDYFLQRPNSVLFHLHNENGTRAWINEGSIRGERGLTGLTGRDGPQGPQGDPGPQGERGLPGSAVQIKGIVDDIDQLPTPEDQETGTAYLVRNRENNYIIWVALPEDATWEQAGPIQASVVTVGGNIVTEFNADTKLDKVSTTGELRVYGINSEGVQTMFKVKSDNIDAYSIAQRNGAGNIRCTTPESDIMAANKKYVDDGLATKLDKRFNSNLDYPCVYQVGANSNTQSLRYLVSTWEDKEEVFTRIPFQYSAAQRDQYGCLQVASPRKGIDAVNKNYAEANFTKKLYRHTIYASCYGNDYDGQSHSINMHFEILSTQSTDASASYVPVGEFVKLLAGPTATVAHVVANGYIDNETIGSVSFTKSDATITVYNHYNELVTAFQEENGVCYDTVQAIG